MSAQRATTNARHALCDRLRHVLWHASTPGIVLFVSSIVLIFPASLIAREVYSADGFVIETVSSIDDAPEYTFIKAGILIPPDGYIYLPPTDSFELLIPCKGWVPDQGILVLDGCPEAKRGGDTLNGPITLTREMGCASKGNRVLVVIRVPRMFMVEKCRPTALRWTGGYHAKDD